MQTTKTTTPNNARQSRVDEKNQHGVAHNDCLQDEQRRDSFSWSSAPRGVVKQ